MAKAGTKAKSDEGTKAAVDQTDVKGEKNGAAAAKVIGEERDVCPECPPGMRRLRSKFRNYRFAGVDFHTHVALVDEKTFQKALKSPHFGQGKDFWEDTAAA